jgi:hypothetical protein
MYWLSALVMSENKISALRQKGDTITGILRGFNPYGTERSSHLRFHYDIHINTIFLSTILVALSWIARILISTLRSTLRILHRSYGSLDSW